MMDRLGELDLKTTPKQWFDDQLLEGHRKTVEKIVDYEMEKTFFNNEIKFVDDEVIKTDFKLKANYLQNMINQMNKGKSYRQVENEPLVDFSDADIYDMIQTALEKPVKEKYEKVAA